MAGKVSAMVGEFRFWTARDLFVAHPEVALDMLASPTDEPPADFCRALLGGRTPEDAITFCAWLLPMPATVWWAHECLSNLDELFDEPDRRLLASVGDWVGAGGNGPPLLEAMAKPDQRTPAVWIALATARSVELPAPRAVNAGILAGLARVALEDRHDVLTAFVEMGLQLAGSEALQRSDA
ncbi:DUF6931 family protein [Aminobacter aganoensis]|uniref:Uncharacterized protein n=1 Tax=Aminobacter aganoensis TaxID=83264 RepID=A0A7X0F3G6_9HYPH|nr:hypothetical protein [Aminobacter aganoensis]MBB6352387.1 hypothetical protein [Aminobacter aganoensis]